MTTQEFFQQFPDEASCILHFKEHRGQRPVLPQVPIQVFELGIYPESLVVYGLQGDPHWHKSACRW